MKLAGYPQSINRGDRYFCKNKIGIWRKKINVSDVVYDRDDFIKIPTVDDIFERMSLIKNIKVITIGYDKFQKRYYGRELNSQEVICTAPCIKELMVYLYIWYHKEDLPSDFPYPLNLSML